MTECRVLGLIYPVAIGVSGALHTGFGEFLDGFFFLADLLGVAVGSS